MTSQTIKRIENRSKIVELALKIYDAKPDEDAKREMFKAYADHIGYTQTIKGQLEWIELLEAKVKNLPVHCPDCDDRGWYLTGKNGEPEQVQCEFCHTTPNSYYNKRLNDPSIP